VNDLDGKILDATVGMPVARSVSTHAAQPWLFSETRLPKRCYTRIVMAVLLAVVVAVGVPLPGVAQRPAQMQHAMLAADMPAMVMMHHRAARTAAAGLAKPAHDCGKACPLCAMTCCGVILATIAPIPPRSAQRHLTFAAAPRLGRGVLAATDPYPPRAASQS
jgi:hypothetical protein